MHYHFPSDTIGHPYVLPTTHLTSLLEQHHWTSSLELSYSFGVILFIGHRHWNHWNDLHIDIIIGHNWMIHTLALVG